MGFDTGGDINCRLLSDLRDRIQGCFFKWTIKDPYPELTQWDEMSRMVGIIGRLPLFRNLHDLGPRPEVSAHKAWRDGYDFAKSLVMKELGE